MTGTYNLVLIGLSLGVAVLTSYTLLDLAARMRKVEGTSLLRRCWLLGGAAVIGSGVWSMHFLGMLACRMTMEVRYDVVLTALSWLIAVSVIYAVLRLTTEGEASAVKVATGALLAGTSLGAMHYSGMAAMLLQRPIQYDMVLVAVSLLIAVSASSVALWLTLALRDGTAQSVRWKRYMASLVMGVGIAGMHYSGMYAARIVPDAVVASKVGIGTGVLEVLVTVFSLGVMAVAVALAMMDEGVDEILRSASVSLHIGAGRLNAMNGLDPVTGIASRATFLAGLEKKMAEARQNETLLGLVFVDLDGFKTINDSLGYTGGDAVLRAFSDDLQRRTRVDTTMGRMGADEFAVVLDGFDDPDKAEPMAKSILERMKTEFEVEGAMLRVTASAGVALYPRDGANVDALLKSATTAKQQAKQAGKNSFRVFDPTMSDAESRSVQITRGFGEALTQQQFSLVFQPKFDGRENRVTGAEALIRWTHPVLGNVPPMDFIPLAEENGQIVPISEWVIGEVCRQMNVWRDQGLPPVRVAINLSPEQLRLSGYADRVSAMVREAGVEPRMILFEITETAAMREPTLAMAAIAEFQKAGFDFAIDDFGTGYSSMAYLQQFRVKELKIDRFFVGSLEDGPEGHTIVAAIIALAHALNMTVVAEGVETASQLKELNGMNCDEVQGYLLGRPLVPGDFEKLLRGEAERDELAGVAASPRRAAQTAKPRLLSAMA